MKFEKSQPKDSTSQSLQKPARFQSGEQLNFNFIAYEEKIVIVGASGSEKLIWLIK